MTLRVAAKWGGNIFSWLFQESHTYMDWQPHIYGLKATHLRTYKLKATHLWIESHTSRLRTEPHTAIICLKKNQFLQFIHIYFIIFLKITDFLRVGLCIFSLLSGRVSVSKTIIVIFDRGLRSIPVKDIEGSCKMGAKYIFLTISRKPHIYGLIATHKWIESHTSTNL